MKAFITCSCYINGRICYHWDADGSRLAWYGEGSVWEMDAAPVDKCRMPRILTWSAPHSTVSEPATGTRGPCHRADTTQCFVRDRRTAAPTYLAGHTKPNFLSTRIIIEAQLGRFETAQNSSAGDDRSFANRRLRVYLPLETLRVFSYKKRESAKPQRQCTVGLHETVNSNRT